MHYQEKANLKTDRHSCTFFDSVRPFLPCSSAYDFSSLLHLGSKLVSYDKEKQVYYVMPLR